MTPKNKAEELIDLFYRCENAMASQLDNNLYLKELKIAKECALICVDEMIEYTSSLKDLADNIYSLEYLHEVKNQINLL